jgi:hypothetical protein
MPNSIVCRYDNEEYEVGRVVASRGDHFDTLTDDEKAVELGFRAASPAAADIRIKSLYAWEDVAIAKRLFRAKGAEFLYELEIDDASIRHQGDLNVFSAAVDVVRIKPISELIASYWAGEIAGPPWTSPRVEILVSEARVIRRFTRAELFS